MEKFSQIPNVEDSQFYIELLSIYNANEGDCVKFGNYEQSDISGQKKEPLEWYVIKHSEDKTLLLPVLKGASIMVNTENISMEVAKELAFTEEEIKELTEARNKPIVFDEDCPETTPERAVKFRRVNPPRSRHELRA